MVKIEYSERMPMEAMIDYFTNEIGGCLNPVRVDAGGPGDIYYKVTQITGGELNGMLGLLGHVPEKHISWAVATCSNCLYVETFPTSHESYLVIALS